MRHRIWFQTGSLSQLDGNPRVCRRTEPEFGRRRGIKNKRVQSHRNQHHKSEICRGSCGVHKIRLGRRQNLSSNIELHALVNNAGIAEYGQVEWTSMETFHKVLEVNTFGTVRVTKAFLPLLRLKRGSRVVFTASVSGRYTLPGFSAYSMSKHAVISFADALRKEMKPFKISVHTIQPTAYTTLLSSTENIGNSLQSQWDKTEPEVKKSYGENYFQTFKTLYLKGSKKLSKTNSSEVIDDMVDAILSKEPKITYIPSLSKKFMVHMLTTIPMELQDRILSKNIIPDVPPAGLAGTDINDLEIK
ncbi:Hypothetical predicted protein [Cloeon dipterum]|uniref:Uncharacterized protein n=1 Tax=Cloeon dipterum TaxID=197152 RepID=A0A8S1E220_9INSE|nr:Hypothetical predicted protein [Cloeon dipterum]